MATRPPIQKIVYISTEGNPHSFVVGRDCTEIREVQEGAEFCFIPWVEVWNGETLLFRTSQHKLEYIRY